MCLRVGTAYACYYVHFFQQGRKFINMHLNKLWLVRAESRPLGLLGGRLHKRLQLIN